jgi:hypothetical protein
VELAFLIGLAEDSAKAALVLIITGRGVDDESIRPGNLQQVQSREQYEVC